MSDEQEQFVAFRVNDFDLAVPISQVREVVRPLPITALPGGPAFLEGIVELRGAILPVVDLRKRLGQTVPSPTLEDTARLIVASIDGKILALVADEVTEVVRLDSSEVKPAPVSTEHSAIVRVFRYRDKIHLILDLDRLLTSEELGDMAQLAKQLAGIENSHSHGDSKEKQ